MVEFQRPTRSGSKAGSQFSLSCRVLSTGVSWMLGQGMLNFDPTKYVFWLSIFGSLVHDGSRYMSDVSQIAQ